MATTPVSKNETSRPRRNIEDHAFEAPIVEMLKGGESGKAVMALSERYSKRIFKMVQPILRNGHDVEDVIQDTFAHILKNPNSFIPRNPDCTIMTIITTSAIRRSLSMLRLAPRNHEVPIEDTTDSSKINWHYLVDRKTGSALHCLISDQNKKELDAAILLLPKGCRTAIVMKYYDGLSMDEIAQATNKSVGTIKAHLYKGRKMLRGHLENRL